MKKALILFLCFVLVSSTLIGCGGTDEETSANKEMTEEEKSNFNENGYPVVKEKVTLNFVAPKAPLAPNYGEMELIKRLEDETNVHIEWENIPDNGYEEKKNLMLASGDLPDAFYDSRFTDHDIVTYGENGTLIPLENLIEKYAPNIQAIFEKRPDLKSMVTAPDGHIYTLPKAEEMGLIPVPFFTSINKTWLDKLNLEVPTTPEEYKEVLIAFRDQDPNGNGKKDEIPFSFMFEGWCMDIGEFFTPFGVPDNPEHRIVRDGEVIFTATQPGYKEAIKWFHELYGEGLIDPESFTQDAKQYLAKGKTPEATLGSYIWWETEEVVGTERADDYILLPPLKNQEGERVVGRSNYSEYGRAAFAITNANEHPEITMRWVDRLYEPKMSAQVSWGPLGIIYEEDENGMLVNKELPEGTTMGELRQKVAPTGVSVVLKEDFGTVVDMEPRAKQRLQDIEDVYAPYLVEENYPQIFFKPEELEKINTLEVDIKDFISQKRASWIVDGGVEDEWDDYVAKLNKMGLEELMKIYQDGLDRFNNNK